jgi:hypothetical protein
VAVLGSDSDDTWREYERTERFLISIWRKIYEKSNRLGLRLSRMSGGQEARAKTPDHRDRYARRLCQPRNLLEVKKLAAR